MVHINSQSDYKAATAEMEKYVQLKPAYEYGHNFLGFLYSNAHEYKKAQGEFERALQINRLSCYASSKLAPVYYNLYNSLSDMREEKYEYLEKYKNMLKTAANNCTGADYERYVMLIQWKHKVNALPENMQKAPPTPNLPKAPDYDTN
jgi:tetratricopeptide (TPR) repeat protein